MSPKIREILIRGLDNVVGFKFLALVLASVFFGVGKLSETLWVEVVFVVSGLRAATDIAQIVKTGQKAPSEKKKVVHDSEPNQPGT